MAVSPQTTAQNDDALVFSTFQTQLELYKDHEEPYFAMSGEGTKGGRVDPGIITKVNLGDRIGSNVRTMVLPLRTPAKMGDNHIAEDFGESLDMLALRTYSNSWDKVVNRTDNTATLIGHMSGRAFFNYAATSLQNFTPIQRGDYIRQAGLLSYSPNLTTQADGGPGLTQRYPMNWYFNNTPRAFATPAYDSNPATFLANLLAGFSNAGATNNDVANIESVHRLTFISNLIWKTKRIGNIYGGRLIIMMGSRSVSWLQSISTAGSAAFLRKTTFSDKISSMAWSENIGELPGNIIIIEDQRCPIGVYTPSTNSLQIVFRGVDPLVDPREAYVSGPDQKVFELNIVAGQSYFTNTQVSNPMYRDQMKDFNRLSQLAVLAVEGFTITEFDASLAANQTSATRVGQGGGVFATYIPPLY